MRFIDPHIFWWILPAVLLVLFTAVRAAQKRGKMLQQLLGSAADDPCAVRLSRKKRVLRLLLAMLTVFFLFAAAARPYWNSSIIPYSQNGRDIAVLFDVSKSMLATDIAPSRLEHAKYMLREIVRSNPQDRFGLIAFAGTAYTACPLTADPAAFGQYMNELSPDLVPLGGTNLEKALSEAAKTFKAAAGQNRAILLFTDGDELQGDSRKLVNMLKERNIPLFIVGLGDPVNGAPIPDEQGSFRRGADGKVITSRLAEKNLRQLARETRGIYLHSTVNAPGTEVIDRKIKQLDQAAQNSGKRTLPVEKFPLALLAAAIVYLLYLLISERPGKTAILMLCAVLLCGAAEPLPPQAPAEEPLPEQADELYNLARKRQIDGKKNYAELYEKIIRESAGRPDLRSKALFNSGSGVHNAGRNTIAQALSGVQTQQLDEALKKLDAAEKELQNAEELYALALQIPDAASFSGNISGNLQLLAADRRRIEELRKKIRDLQKQQQQAKQDIQNAMDQQKQDQKQKQNQNQKQDQQKDQQKQNQKQDQKQQAVDQAASSTEKLEKMAQDLKQEKLKENAAKAKEEISKAKAEKDSGKKQQHLQNALDALGKNDPSEKQGSGKDQQKQDQSKQPAPQENPGRAGERPAPDAKDRKSKEALLELLEDEENQRREQLMKQRRSRRQRVEKDW